MLCCVVLYSTHIRLIATNEADTTLDMCIPVRHRAEIVTTNRNIMTLQELERPISHQDDAQSITGRNGWVRAEQRNHRYCGD